MQAGASENAPGFTALYLLHSDSYIFRRHPGCNDRPLSPLWCERIIEGGWLLALVFIPSYFNLLSSRHFEPDKATSLRAIVLVMVAAGIIRALELRSHAPRSRRARASRREPAKRAWQRLNCHPARATDIALRAGVSVRHSRTSVVPATSFWGSYQRLQGTYTNLSYIGLATMIVLTLRRREQLDRLITVAILGSLPAVGYGLVQHLPDRPAAVEGRCGLARGLDDGQLDLRGRLPDHDRAVCALSGDYRVPGGARAQPSRAIAIRSGLGGGVCAAGARQPGHAASRRSNSARWCARPTCATGGSTRPR